MTDEETRKTAFMLKDAMKKYGTVHQHHYRPIKQCFAAGLCYTVGGIVGLGGCVFVAKGLAFVIDFIVGWFH